jgi:diguanylate cyclase
VQELAHETSLPDARTYRRRRAGGDLYGRSIVGPIFYALGCVLTAAVGGYFRPVRLLGWLPARLFVLFFFLRRANRPPVDFADAASVHRWRLRHWGLIHAGCALWAAVFVYVGSAERASGLPLTIPIICTVTFGAALSQAFAMELRQTALTLTILYGPGLVFFASVPGLRSIAVTLGLYGLYLLSSLRRLSREYDTQIQTEYALMLSRTEVERLTRVDALTGLANRREYDHAFPQAWHQAVRLKGDMALLVCDIDHFKAVNDRHGHLAGDACLQHFAGILRANFRREVDLLARIGGEEFVVILPGTSMDAAAALAEQFRESLERAPCPWEGDQLPFTVSVGVGRADGETDATPDATFARVDAACYDAKTLGRNRVVLATARPGAEA